MVSQRWETKGIGDYAWIEPRIMSQWCEMEGTKNKVRQNLGWHPNDEKPNEQANKLWLNLGWHLNQEKPNKLRFNWDGS